MKKTLIICIALILMSNIFAQQENTKDFNYWYDQFIEKQKEPFMDGRCEGFKLGNIIWQRYYGEKEYFLSPMFSDSEIKKYYDRIKRFDDKKKGILKSQTHFIKVELNKITISLLSKFLINVPDYIHDKILVRLPEIDIDMLMKHNCNFELIENYGQLAYNLAYQKNKIKETKQIIWSENWEGAITPYSRGNNPAYWGDVNCESYEGDWSMWCADDGSGAPSSNCSQYIDDMDAYIYKTTGINISGYTNLHFEAKIKWDTEPDYDYLRFLTKFDGTNWTEMWNFNASSGGWATDVWDFYGYYDVFWWRYDFDSDESIHNYEGAYLDYMKVTGDLETYTISTSSNPTNGGTTSGGGTYYYGQTCTVSASENTGYNFANWKENGTIVSYDPNYSFTVTTNRNLEANFTPIYYIITTASNPSNGGTTSGGGTYNYGQSCTVSASENSGWQFINWTESGNTVSTNSNYTFTVTGPRYLVANFSQLTYTITTSSNPSNGGTTSGGGTYNYGQSCTVSASENSGWQFINWTESGNTVSTNSNYTFTVTGPRYLVANFSQLTYTITTSSNPSNGGSTSGGGTYYYNDPCTVTATPNSGWQFDNWTENGNVVSTNPNYSFNVTSNRNLVANFSLETALHSNHVNNLLKIYPNPVIDIIYFEITESGLFIKNIEIFSGIGKSVYHSDFDNTNNLIKIPLTDFHPGIYFVKIQTSKGIITRKIIIQR